jgi:HD-like signal output (HDOD) protein
VGVSGAKSRGQAPERLDPLHLATLAPRDALEAIASSGRTALVLLDRGARVGEVWLDRGRVLCSDDVDSAAVSLAELLAWPKPQVTVVPGARRTGPCTAIPAEVVLRRASEITEQRLASLSAFADPTEIHEVAEGATATDGDASEQEALAAIAGGESPFTAVPTGHRSAAIAAALVRLLLRRAIRRAPPVGEVRTPSERPTDPGAQGGLSRLMSWVRSSFAGRDTSPPASRAEPARPSRIPGWRASRPGEARPDPPAPEDTSWAVMPWDRDRAAVATTANEIAARLSETLPLERAHADPATDRLLSLLEGAIARGLEDVAPMSALALELRDAISKETTAREVTAMIEPNEPIVRAVLRAGAAAAFGSPPATLEQAVVRVGLNRVYRIATTPLVRTRSFEARVLGARAQRIRSACQLAGELAASLATGPAREDLFLAGLLHGLGRLYLATLADQVPRLPAGRLEELASAYQCSIGVLLAARWNLGADVRLSIGTHVDASVPPLGAPRRDNEPLSLPSTLRLAQIVATAMTEDPPVPDWRIAKVLGASEDAASSTGPLFDRARSLLHGFR